MKKTLMIAMVVLLANAANATTIKVNNQQQLDSAAKVARPGDVIELRNGTWANTAMILTCTGTEKAPIIVKAQTAGKVFMTGKSSLQLGGEYITVDGLYFKDGASPLNAVLTYRVGKKVANHCRITNTVINDFNNKRRDENYWVALYGKNNRLDHNSFLNKKNFGVLLAVVMDDERSRNSFHSIDNNYFGPRPTLGSNSGETIRVGVSQHCTFNSNTQIINNVFDRCDGETEIISIKSCGNVIRNNIFRECQGSVTLRHGNDNVVEGNLFLGNKKQATGGVRIINENQWVVNNLFYQMNGRDFRSPLVVMNGVPNSPANRYLPVRNAVISNNTFIESNALSMCEGSDTERSEPPKNVFFINNSFYNHADSSIYYSHDKMDSIFFTNNVYNKLKGPAPAGFSNGTMSVTKSSFFPFPVSKEKSINNLPVDIAAQASGKLKSQLPATVGAAPLAYFQNLLANEKNTGASWAHNAAALQELGMAPVTIACSNAKQLENVFKLNSKAPVIIKLTGSEYEITSPIVINTGVTFTQTSKKPVKIIAADLPAVFLLNGGGNLMLNNVNLNLEEAQTRHFILTDTVGNFDHFNLVINNSTISNQQNTAEETSFIFASKSSFGDSVVITNSSFNNNASIFFNAIAEREDKGIYNVEKTRISQNKFSGQRSIINIYRGGNDESTLGPNLIFTNNFVQTNAPIDKPAFNLFGVQQSNISNNIITNSNAAGTLIRYKDLVRAQHILQGNIFTTSGKIETNNFVQQKNNLTK
jgi:poly(beta-D-mannuronate) lyase